MVRNATSALAGAVSSGYSQVVHCAIHWPDGMMQRMRDYAEGNDGASQPYDTRTPVSTKGTTIVARRYDKMTLTLE